MMKIKRQINKRKTDCPVHFALCLFGKQIIILVNNRYGIGEQCSESIKNLRKNNSKRAYQPLKDLTTVKHGKVLLSKTIEENAYRRLRDTDRMDRILLWAVQSHSQWRSINTELSPDRHRGQPSRLHREVEAAVQSLKKGKSAGVGNI